MENWTKKIHVGSSLPAKDGQYAMFVGRWQPLHPGHQELFKQAMDEGKKEHYSNECEEGKVKVMVIPDICSIEFGRGVGYDIIERIPPQQIADISATKIREQMKKEGKL